MEIVPSYTSNKLERKKYYDLIELNRRFITVEKNLMSLKLGLHRGESLISIITAEEKNNLALNLFVSKREEITSEREISHFNGIVEYIKFTKFILSLRKVLIQEFKHWLKYIQDTSNKLNLYRFNSLSLYNSDPLQCYDYAEGINRLECIILESKGFRRSLEDDDKAHGILQQLESEAELFICIYRLNLDLLERKWQMFSIHLMESVAMVFNLCRHKSQPSIGERCCPNFLEQLFGFFSSPVESEFNPKAFLVDMYLNVVRIGAFVFYDSIFKFDSNPNVLRNYSIFEKIKAKGKSTLNNVSNNFNQNQHPNPIMNEYSSTNNTTNRNSNNRNSSNPYLHSSPYHNNNINTSNGNNGKCQSEQKWQTEIYDSIHSFCMKNNLNVYVSFVDDVSVIVMSISHSDNSKVICEKIDNKLFNLDLKSFVVEYESSTVSGKKNFELLGMLDAAEQNFHFKGYYIYISNSVPANELLINTTISFYKDIKKKWCGMDIAKKYIIDRE